MPTYKGDLPKLSGGKVFEGGCTTFFQGPLFKSWKLKSLWGVALGERISAQCFIFFFVKPKIKFVRKVGVCS